MVRQMQILRERLSEMDIAWWDESDLLIDRTKFELNGNRWSVINGEGTYGGRRFGLHDNQGLLELRIGNSEPIGWLTVNDVIHKIVVNTPRNNRLNG